MFKKSNTFMYSSSCSISFIPCFWDSLFRTIRFNNLWNMCKGGGGAGLGGPNKNRLIRQKIQKLIGRWTIIRNWRERISDPWEIFPRMWDNIWDHIKMDKRSNLRPNRQIKWRERLVRVEVKNILLLKFPLYIWSFLVLVFLYFFNT